MTALLLVGAIVAGLVAAVLRRRDQVEEFTDEEWQQW